MACLPTSSALQCFLANGHAPGEARLRICLPAGVSNEDLGLELQSVCHDDGNSSASLYLSNTTSGADLGCVYLQGYELVEHVPAVYSKNKARYTVRLRKKAQVNTPLGENKVYMADCEQMQAASVDRGEDEVDVAVKPTMAPDSDWPTHHLDNEMKSSNDRSTVRLRSKESSEEDHHDENVAVKQVVKCSNEQFAENASESTKSGHTVCEPVPSADGACQDTVIELDAQAPEAVNRRVRRRRRRKKGSATEVDTETAEEVTPEPKLDLTENDDLLKQSVAKLPETSEPQMAALSEHSAVAAPVGGNEVKSKNRRKKARNQKVKKNEEIPKDNNASANYTANGDKGSSLKKARDGESRQLDDVNAIADKFLEEPTGKSEIGIDVPHCARHGPFIRFALAKNEKLGEDKWLQQAKNSWQLKDAEDRISFSAFGIMDGHGGKSASVFASKHLLGEVMDHVDRSPNAGLVSLTVDGGSAEDMKVWSLQDEFISRLPQALKAGYLKTDQLCTAKFKTSGTTATLAMICGWELVVANVGDSCAYLDTGSQICMVSGNHRIADNAEERERLESYNVEVSPTIDPETRKPMGPLRVWPGGLAMSRTLGDSSASPLVVAEPEVRQWTLPVTGARLIIASDGLWDAVNPKSLLHQARNQTAATAVNMVLFHALKKKGLRDDITVLIVDFCPDEEHRYPPTLAHGSTAKVDGINVFKPLETDSESWRHRLASRRSAGIATLSMQQEEKEESSHEGNQGSLEAQQIPAGAMGSDKEVMPSSVTNTAKISDTYRELLELRVDPASLVSSTEDSRDAIDWVMVGEGKSQKQKHARKNLSKQREEVKASGHRHQRGKHEVEKDHPHSDELHELVSKVIGDLPRTGTRIMGHGTEGQKMDSSTLHRLDGSSQHQRRVYAPKWNVQPVNSGAKFRRQDAEAYSKGELEGNGAVDMVSHRKGLEGDHVSSFGDRRANFRNIRPRHQREFKREEIHLEESNIHHSNSADNELILLGGQNISTTTFQGGGIGQGIAMSHEHDDVTNQHGLNSRYGGSRKMNMNSNLRANTEVDNGSVDGCGAADQRQKERRFRQPYVQTRSRNKNGFSNKAHINAHHLVDASLQQK